MEKVKITSRQLMSHTSGIRHYEKKNKKTPNAESNPNQSSGDSVYPEFLLNKEFKTPKEALGIFINDELLS